jgi:hypothetical protein
MAPVTHPDVVNPVIARFLHRAGHALEESPWDAEQERAPTRHP